MSLAQPNPWHCPRNPKKGRRWPLEETTRSSAHGVVQCGIIRILIKAWMDIRTQLMALKFSSLLKVIESQTNPKTFFQMARKYKSSPKFNVECSGCHLGVTASAEGQMKPKKRGFEPFWEEG